jgi:Rrf2 family protein
LAFMRTSCRFAMAVHVLAVLAYKEGDRVTSALLAGSVNTNPVIIRRLLLALQRARLVETCKGAGAGSRLSRSPRRINLAEVYRAVEGVEPFATPSRKPDAACPVGYNIRNTLDRIFVSAQSALEQDLAKTTLADVMDTVKIPRPGTAKKTS